MYLSDGEQVSVKLNLVFPGSPKPSYWTIWIDYNYDGDFSDSGEKV